MAPIHNYEQHAQRLMEPDLPMPTRLQMAMEVRDSLEIAHTSEYLNFLRCYFRAFSAILTQMTTPQFTETVENKLRNVVVEILNRLPHSEVLRPFVQDLLKVSLQVLTKDNEDNALIAVRIIFDLLRNFRPTVEAEVQPFLDFVGTIYRNFPGTVAYFFNNPASTGGGGTGGPGGVGTPAPSVSSNSSGMMPGLGAGIGAGLGSGGGSLGDDVSGIGSVSSLDGPTMSAVSYNGGSAQLNPSTRSFKIITESPLVVIFLFQLYSKLVQTNIPHLLPLMINTISITGPEHVPPHLKNHFAELKGAQVKTLSFLTYLLATFATHIKPQEENLCKSIVNLLVTCPDSVSIRKELLIGLKHVLASEFKRGLFPLIDTLLDERALVGTGRACIETLRPLAYSLLAEIVHHVRGELSLPQLSRIIYLFSRNLHDPSLNLAIHTTSARLMLNLVEPIYEKGIDQTSMDESRVLLGRILDAFVGKFATLKRAIPQLLEGDDGKDWSNLRLKLEAPIQAILNLQSPMEHSKEVSDYKNLIKTLVMGNMFYSIYVLSAIMFVFCFMFYLRRNVTSKKGPWLSRMETLWTDMNGACPGILGTTVLWTQLGHSKLMFIPFFPLLLPQPVAC